MPDERQQDLFRPTLDYLDETIERWSIAYVCSLPRPPKWISWFGALAGPRGTYCKDCENCSGVQCGKTHVYKCSVRGDTRSNATDIRLKWPSCRFFSKEKHG